MSPYFPQPTFWRSLTIQRRVIGALLMREVVTRFGRDNLGTLWFVAEPMLFTLGVTAIWTAAGLTHGSDLPIVAFGVTGYSSVLLWRNCASRCSMAIDQNMGLLYHRNVRVVDVLLTRIILEAAGATASFVILSAFFISLGWMAAPVDLATVLEGWLMLAWFGAVLALAIGAGTAYSHTVEKLWGPTSYLLFPLSGAAFMVDWLPPAMRDVVTLLPMVHGVEMVREGYFGNAVRTHYDVGYMAAVCLTLTLFALFLVRRAEDRLETA